MPRMGYGRMRTKKLRSVRFMRTKTRHCMYMLTGFIVLLAELAEML